MGRGGGGGKQELTASNVHFTGNFDYNQQHHEDEMYQNYDGEGDQ